MRRIRTGRGTTVTEIPDVHACSGCGHPFEQRLYTTSWSNCSCTPGEQGHRIYVCLRGSCRAETFDPPHDGSAFQAPLEGHRGG